MLPGANPSAAAPGSLAMLAAMRPGFVAGELFECRSVALFIFEIDVAQRLPIVVLHDEAGPVVFDGPGRREVARWHTII